MNPKNIQEKEIKNIHSKLLDRYGQPEEPKDLTGTEYLVETILSQNTNDKNRDKAFNNLQEEYNSWEEIENGSRGRAYRYSESRRLRTYESGENTESSEDNKRKQKRR
ncbi:MAG: hypothetical protein J07AB43_08630 [Candidatus Nanosalina sp. J07AB43]|nr:MAG: hypothetical protein J07AB43_08630 [Candidatus Nanosalina sp. J07AB43]